MKLVRPSHLAIALLLALALLAGGASPLVAAVCAGGGACPCPGMAGVGEPCAGPVLTVEMSCCADRAPAATAPGPSALVAPQVAAAPPAAGETQRVLAAIAAAQPASAGALARAEQRSELGLFTLHDVFRI
jgi:hypothetical protein